MVVPICNPALGLWRQEGQKFRVILTSHVQGQSRIHEMCLKTQKERREWKGRKEAGRRRVGKSCCFPMGLLSLVMLTEVIVCSVILFCV